MYVILNSFNVQMVDVFLNYGFVTMKMIVAMDQMSKIVQKILLVPAEVSNLIISIINNIYLFKLSLYFLKVSFYIQIYICIIKEKCN